MSRSEESEFMPVPAHINLDDVCVVKDYRKIRSDHTFSYANKFYLIDSPLRHSIAKQKIEIRTGHDDGFDAYFAGRHLAVSVVIEPTKPGGPLPQLAWGEYGPRHHGLTCPGLVTRGLCCGVRKPSTQSHNEEGRS